MTQGVTTCVELPPRGRYRHFKGGEYDLLDIAQHSETGDLLVVYRSVADPDRTWVRPAEMFCEQVDRPEGSLPRFQLAKPAQPRSFTARLGAAVSGVARQVSSALPRLTT